MAKALISKHLQFIAEYRTDRNAARAYRAVYGVKSPLTAGICGHKLLKVNRVAAEIARLDAEMTARLQIDTEEVLIDAIRVLRADARGLSSVLVGCCRCCYGVNSQPQRTLMERLSALAKWEKSRKPADEEFDEQGGIGFDPRLPPQSTCPNCAGEGEARIKFGDTRYFTPDQVALYDGVKSTKEGMQVITRSRDNARELLARHLGIFALDNKQKSPPLADAVQSLLGGLQGGGGRLGHSPAQVVNVEAKVIPNTTTQP